MNLRMLDQEKKISDEIMPESTAIWEKYWYWLVCLFCTTEVLICTLFNTHISQRSTHFHVPLRNSQQEPTLHSKSSSSTSLYPSVPSVAVL